jgi:hypothetical protein
MINQNILVIQFEPFIGRSGYIIFTDINLFLVLYWCLLNAILTCRGRWCQAQGGYT